MYVPLNKSISKGQSKLSSTNILLRRRVRGGSCLWTEERCNRVGIVRSTVIPVICRPVKADLLAVVCLRNRTKSDYQFQKVSSVFFFINVLFNLKKMKKKINRLSYVSPNFT